MLMMSLLRDLLTHALRAARDLTEPDEINHEYVRGQMNLICDMFGLSVVGLGDWVQDDITGAITSREAVNTVVQRIIEALRA